MLPRRTLAILIALITAVPHATGQGIAAVDSMLASWPVRQKVPEARLRPRNTPPVGFDADEVRESLLLRAPALPVLVDSTVLHYAGLYAGPRREQFRVLLGMAEAYGPLIERELARHGLPPEFKYLPMALSGMDPRAHNNTGEAGLWMLPWPVALRYGLRVDAFIDERYDAARCTEAAARWLQDLQGIHSDRASTLLAFAGGPANLQRARLRTGEGYDARTLYPWFRNGHREVLPLLMAFIHLSANHGTLGLEPIPMRVHEATDTVHTAQELALRTVARIMDIAEGRLRHLNPVLASALVPEGHPLVLPKGEGPRFLALQRTIAEAQASLPRTSPPTAVADTVERLPDGREAILYRITTDDCINCIAERFHVTPEEIRTWNELQGDALDVGNTLVLFVEPERRKRYEGNGANPDSLLLPQRTNTLRTVPKPADGTDFIWYTVRSGDSLYRIAQRYPGVSADDLMRYNRIGPSIRPGQRIKVPRR